MLNRFAFASLLFLSFASVGWGQASDRNTPESKSDTAKEVKVTEGDQRSAILSQIKSLSSRLKPSIVVISVTGRDGKQQSIGSGFVIDADGLIATNHHVIGEARPIHVEFDDGSKHRVTEVHATERAVDLAILRIDAKSLPALPFGDSGKLKQGEMVLALGNPRGLRHSVVHGLVSGRREIDDMQMIQIAIPIEKGNSGGPLVDLEGRVQGIMTMKSLETDNLGFAVPINAIKPLVQKPNPIPIDEWLTIGVVDSEQWLPLFGASWKQRAGRLRVSGRGAGFGGRSLCLSQLSIPEGPHEIAVNIRMGEEDGAAGIVFYSDGKDRHFGFYPSSGNLRLSQFNGPDVFSWNVIQEVRSRHYRPGEWNHLKVQLDGKMIKCFCNDELVIEHETISKKLGRAGVGKFRHTSAEFKQFQIANAIAPLRPEKTAVQKVHQLVAELPTNRPPHRDVVDDLIALDTNDSYILQERARELEKQAERLRQLAKRAHAMRVQRKIVEEFGAKQQIAESSSKKTPHEKEPSEKQPDGDEDANLLRAALLVAQLDNPDVDVDYYVRQVDRMAELLSERINEKSTQEERREVLHQYLFRERGFHGSRTEYYNSSNSYLNEVIDDREGLPITLSVLYLELGRRIGMNVEGIGLPGHFVVGQTIDNKLQLIDVFERGKLLSDREAQNRVVIQAGIPWKQAYLKPVSKRQIVSRMLHNLLGLARSRVDIEAMLRYVNVIVALDPESTAEERFLRAVLYLDMNQLDEADNDMNWLAEFATDDIGEARLIDLRRFADSARKQN